MQRKTAKSEEAVFQDYEHEKYLKRMFPRLEDENEESKNKNYIRLSELTVIGIVLKCILIMLGFAILLTIVYFII